jgi:hypothetical protein
MATESIREDSMNERESIFFTLGALKSEIEGISDTLKDCEDIEDYAFKAGVLKSAIHWVRSDLESLRNKLEETVNE